MIVVAKGRNYAALLNEELAAALGGVNKFNGRHSAGEALIECADADVPAAVAVIDAHIGRSDLQHAAAVLDFRARGAIDGIDRLQFEHMFDLENTTRALKANVNAIAPGTWPAGQAAQISRVQYRNALIARWKELNP